MGFSVVYRPEIDGLRALAVVPVILFHAGFSSFAGGFVGVDVFFVISGFLITSIILEEREAGSFTFAGFYERRARRILPALFLVGVVSLCLAWFILSPWELRSFSQSLAAVSVFGSNLFFLLTSDYFSTAAELKPLLHTWSLAIEEQFYVFFPIALLVAWRFGLRRIFWGVVTVGVVSLAASVWLTQHNQGAAFYLLPTRAWELMAGVLVALYLHGEPEQRQPVSEVLGAIGLVLVLVPVVLFDKNTPFPSWRALLPTIGTALVIAFASGRTWVGRALRIRALVGMGLISYSAYLWHQPLFAFARHRSLDEPGALAYVFLILLALAAAFLSWKFVERPARDRDRFTRAQVCKASVAGTILLVAFGIAGHAANGVPQRFDAKTRELFATTMRLYEDEVNDCWKSIMATPPMPCKIGRKDAEPSVVLAGDSHAGAFLGALSERLSNENRGGVSYTSRSCPPLKYGEPARFTSGETECVGIRRAFFGDDLDKLPPVVVLSARWTVLMEKSRFDNGHGGVEAGADWEWRGSPEYSHTDSMARNFAASVNAILVSGRKVVLIYPVPEMGWDVPARLAKLRVRNGELRLEDGSVSHAAFLERNRRTYAALDAIQHSNVVRVKPELVLCNTMVPGRCAAHLRGKSLYYDNNHLSAEGARMVLSTATL